MDRVERLERQLKEGSPATVAPTAVVSAASQPEKSAPASQDLPPWEDAEPADAAPWDEIPLPEPPPEEEEEILVVQPPHKETTEKPTPVSSVPAAPNAGDPSADGIWKQFLAALQKENLPLYVMARCASGVMLKDDVLSIRFDKAGYAEGLTKPAKKKVLDTVMASVAPKVKLSLQSSSDASDDTVARVRALFGEKLEILD